MILSMQKKKKKRLCLSEGSGILREKRQLKPIQTHETGKLNILIPWNTFRKLVGDFLQNACDDFFQIIKEQYTDAI